MLKRHADEARILMHLFTCTLSVFVPLEIVMKKMLKTLFKVHIFSFSADILLY